MEEDACCMLGHSERKQTTTYVIRADISVNKEVVLYGVQEFDLTNKQMHCSDHSTSTRTAFIARRSAIPVR
jgi:hypothetical protein